MMQKHASDKEQTLTFAGCRVLVVEDEYLLAQEIAHCLKEHGAQIVGPVPTVKKALRLIWARDAINAAVLDIDLGGISAMAVARALRQRELPFVFATAFDPSVIPDEYRDITCCQKPFDCKAIENSLLATLRRASSFEARRAVSRDDVRVCAVGL